VLVMNFAEYKLIALTSQRKCYVMISKAIRCEKIEHSNSIKNRLESLHAKLEEEGFLK